MLYEWSAEPLNLLSPEIVTKVRTALEVGIVCGVHAFYCAGGSPEPCAFADLDSYVQAVEKSHPGDWFKLWSVSNWGDYDFFDRIQDLAYRCAATGEFAVLPMTDVWTPELWLVDAKRPNDRGEVPLGGAY